MGNYFNKLCGGSHTHDELDFYQMTPIINQQISKQKVLFEGYIRVEKIEVKQQRGRSLNTSHMADLKKKFDIDRNMSPRPNTEMRMNHSEKRMKNPHANLMNEEGVNTFSFDKDDNSQPGDPNLFPNIELKSNDPNSDSKAQISSTDNSEYTKGVPTIKLIGERKYAILEQNKLKLFDTEEAAFDHKIGEKPNDFESTFESHVIYR